MMLIGIFQEILHITLLSSVLILCLFILRICFRSHLSPKVYYLLWLVLLIRLVFPLHLATHLSIENILPSMPSISMDTTEPSPHSVEVIVTSEYEGTPDSRVPASKSIPHKQPMNPLLVGAFVWLCGIIIIMIIPFVSYWVVKLELRRAIPYPEERLQASLRQVASSLDYHLPVKVVCSTLSKSPALIGIWRPTIVLPYSSMDLDDDKLYTILLHECVHYKHKHLIYQWLFWIAKAIFWFNPLMWIAHHYMKQDAEYWCDREVVTILGDDHKADYGHLILDIATKRDVILDIATTGFGHEKRHIKQRLLRIMDTRGITKSLKNLSIGAILFITLICFTTKADSRAPLIDRDIEEVIEAESYQLHDEFFTIQPTHYIYNEKKKYLKVFVDYEMNLPVTIDAYLLHLSTHLRFSSSKHPAIRNSGIPGVAIRDDKNNIIGFKYRLHGYKPETHGIATLSLSNATINTEPSKDITLKVDASQPNDLTMDMEGLGRIEISQIQQRQNVVYYTLDATPNLMLRISPEFDVYLDGHSFSSASASLSYDSNYKMHKEVTARFDQQKVHSEQISFQLRDITISLLGSIHFDNPITWRFPIQSP